MTENQKNLFSMQDSAYKAFHCKLIPNVSPDRVIGVRTPMLRAYAARIAGTSAEEEILISLPHTYYEENNLHGFLISQMKDYNRVIEEVDRFLPYVDNWATCDLMSPKVFRKYLPELLGKIREWTNSDKTYTIRFGVEMLMSFYLDDAFQPEYHEIVSSIRSEEYYVNMMVAWYFATALAKQYEATLPYLTERKLQSWTHNKTIQKAIESYRISDSRKEYLRNLKIKKLQEKNE